jgi:hypothetical protein
LGGLGIGGIFSLLRVLFFRCTGYESVVLSSVHDCRKICFKSGVVGYDFMRVAYGLPTVVVTSVVDMAGLLEDLRAGWSTLYADLRIMFNILAILLILRSKIHTHVMTILVCYCSRGESFRITLAKTVSLARQGRRRPLADTVPN